MRNERLTTKKLSVFKQALSIYFYSTNSKASET